MWGCGALRVFATWVTLLSACWRRASCIASPTPPCRWPASSVTASTIGSSHSQSPTSLHIRSTHHPVSGNPIIVRRQVSLQEKNWLQIGLTDHVFVVWLPPVFSDRCSDCYFILTNYWAIGLTFELAVRPVWLIIWLAICHAHWP